MTFICFITAKRPLERQDGGLIITIEHFNGIKLCLWCSIWCDLFLMLNCGVLFSEHFWLCVISCYFYQGTRTWLNEVFVFFLRALSDVYWIFYLFRVREQDVDIDLNWVIFVLNDVWIESSFKYFSRAGGAALVLFLQHSE